MRVYQCRHWRPPTEACVALCPILLLLVRNHTNHLHNFIVSFTVTIYHVSDASYNRIIKFLTLPSNIPSCHKVLPKADQEGSSRPSACLPVAGLRLHYRHPRHPSRSSSRIRQISQWRREIDQVVGPNRQRPQRFFCHDFWRRQCGTSIFLG